MDTSEQDVVVDLSSITAIKRELLWRWVPFYASLVLKLVPIALLCGLGIHWLIRLPWPEAVYVSPLIIPSAFGFGALLICLCSFLAKLRLDIDIKRRLSSIEGRIIAGETVYVSEVYAWRVDGDVTDRQSSLNKSLERTRDG